MSDRAWTSDRIQFPRLLAELRAVGLSREQYAGLEASMDLQADQIDELLERAEAIWEGAQGNPATEERRIPMSARDSADWPGHEAQGRALACELGDGWILHQASHEPEQYQSWYLIRQADGLRLSLGWPEAYGAAKLKPARLVIALVWPADGDGQRRILHSAYKQPAYITEITIDASKGAAQIAKEITRRLIVHVEPLHVRALALIQQSHEAGAAQADTVARILAAEPGAHISQNSGPNVIYLGPTSHGYTVRVDGARSVRFEAFSVDDPAMAIRVLLTLRKPSRYACSLCTVPITDVQAQLSTLRADDAEPTCVDCLTLQATRAALDEGHDYIDPTDIARMELAQRVRIEARA